LFTGAVALRNPSKNIQPHLSRLLWHPSSPLFTLGIFYGAFNGLGLYLRDHFAVPRPLSMWIVLIGVIAPWCVSIYFACRAARAANKTLRAIGSCWAAHLSHYRSWSWCGDDRQGVCNMFCALRL